VTVRVLVRRYGFAVAYLGCFLAVELTYSLLDPDAQARLIAWASTNVTNLEHEPVGPLLASAFVAPGYFGVWPVLIALALFGANRALGNVRTARASSLTGSTSASSRPRTGTCPTWARPTWCCRPS